MLLKIMMKIVFALTSKKRAIKNIEKFLSLYLKLADKNELDLYKNVKVPKFVGVDEDMREWSYAMLLEHNVIVNKSISDVVNSLANNKEPNGENLIKDIKKDVMPTNKLKNDIVKEFKSSVEAHINLVKSLDFAGKNRTYKHPIFGVCNAHGWNCIFMMHLKIHLKQADFIVNN